MLGIAWEMWQREIFLFPVLNDTAYPGQPPLMPWLILLGWKAFGVNDWWPRLIPALFSLFSLFVIGRLAALLWMDQLKMPRFLPYIMIGTWLWVYSLTFVLTGNLLMFFSLLALFGILRPWRYTTRAGWLLFGVATGLAILSSGFVALLYILPVALLAPLWAGREHAIRWFHWYLDILAGLGVALGLVAIWGLVITIEYGYGYAVDHLLGAMPAALKMYDENLPVYAYLILLPIAFLPWSAWPLMYSRLWQVIGRRPSMGTLFCLVWIAPVLIVLSIIGPRQPQFLLPLIPAFVLLVTYLLCNEELFDHGEQRFSVSMTLPFIFVGLALTALPLLPPQTWVPDLVVNLPTYVGVPVLALALSIAILPRLKLVGRTLIIIIGLTMVLIPALPRFDFMPAILWELPLYIGLTVAIIGVAIIWLPRFDFNQRIIRNTLFNIFALTAAVFVINMNNNELDNIQRSAAYLQKISSQQAPIAHVGDYDGTYHYYGRLTQAFAELEPDEVDAWLRRYPRGFVITYTDSWQPSNRLQQIKPVFSSNIDDRVMQLWSAASLRNA